MSDFLAVFGRPLDPGSLLDFVRAPYRSESRQGLVLNFSWGSLAILRDPFSPTPSIRQTEGKVMAWVGELGEARDAARLAALHEALADRDPRRALAHAANLTGAFALCHASDERLRLITDIGAFTPIYVATGPSGEVTALGTHPDLVAVAGLQEPTPDLVSMAHFLDYGHAGPPGTMHLGLTMLPHASIHTVGLGIDTKRHLASTAYWSAPPEDAAGTESAFAEELRHLLTAVVGERCQEEKVAVCLSGGLDSRVVLSAVPAAVDCTAVTFFDCFNREAATAREVATAFGRKWLPLRRDDDFLASQLEPVVDLSGGEGEWVTAHELGFVSRFREEGFGSLLHGLNFDSFLKGYQAKDLSKRKRLGGLLPSVWDQVEFDFAAEPNKNLRGDLVQASFRDKVIARRRQWSSAFIDTRRQSQADSLGSFPSFRRFHANWNAERRVMPIRMPALDRRIVDFMFRCPTQLRMEGRLLSLAARDLLRPASAVANANTGVRFGSSGLSALVQRSRRLAGEKIIRALGFEKIEHSWHDYEHYWLHNPKLRELVRRHGPQLECLAPDFFIKSPESTLEDPRIHWTSGFRMLQIALWLERMSAYRDAFARICQRVPVGVAMMDRRGASQDAY